MRVLFFFCALLLSAPGCAGAAALPADVSKQAPFCPDCNVILISLDTLRADSLGTYGYSKNTSPNLDRLARKGTVFLNAYAQAPNTFASHMSILTGQYPWTHKVIATFKDRLPEATATLPMLFRAQGYRTAWAAPTNDPYLALDAGFSRGFEDFIDGFDNFLDPDWYRKKNNSLFTWLTENRQRKFFMFLHTYRTHDPYLPEKKSLLRFTKQAPAQYLSRQALQAGALDVFLSELLLPQNVIPRPKLEELPLSNTTRMLVRAKYFDNCHNYFWKDFRKPSGADVQYLKTLYDALVFEADTALGDVYKKLEELGLAEKTLLVITSDHGEEFKEHGKFNHRQLYLENLHVPLIFVFPGRGNGLKITRTAQSIDIAPTILQAAGIPVPPSAQGSSLLPQITGEDCGQRNPLAFAGPWDGAYTVRDNRYTYLVRTAQTIEIPLARPGLSERFYDRETDPGELINVISTNKEAAARFAASLAQKLAAAGKALPQPWQEGISEQTKQRILSTGYW